MSQSGHTLPKLGDFVSAKSNYSPLSGYGRIIKITQSSFGYRASIAISGDIITWFLDELTVIPEDDVVEWMLKYG